MTASPSNRPPGFLWQGVLILLPVVVLAVASLISLRQDERAAETDAHRRAAENVQTLVRAMRSSVNDELQRFLTLQNLWSMMVRSESQPNVTLVDGFPDAKLAADIAKWDRDYPRFQLADVALPPARVLADGRQIEPPDFPIAPQPPSWFVDLTREQRSRWEALRAAQSQSELNQRFQAFAASQPSAAALQAANLVRGGASGQAYFSEEAFPSESGIEFADISSLQLLRQPHPPSAEALMERVWWRLFAHPSILSPQILNLAQSLTNRLDASHQEKFRWMQRYFAMNSDVHHQLASLRQLPELQPWKKVGWSHWTADRSTLAIFQPMTYAARADARQAGGLAGPGYEIRLVPADLVATLFRRAADENKYLIPPYASAQFTVENVPLSLPVPVPTERLLLAGAEQNVGSSPTQDAIHFEVKFYLTSRRQMLAAEYRRARLFGALVVSAAFTALAGWFFARRSFRRQQELNALKTNFVSSVSHELRAPIASVRLMAENLERGSVTDPGKQREYFKFIGQECRRLSSLIENVLDFSRIEQGRKQYEFEPTDLAALTTTTVKLLEPYAAEKGVRLACRWAGEAAKWELNLDGRALQQALINLMDNAIKHSAAGQTVTVEITRAAPGDGRHPRPATIHLSVLDQGPGIPAGEHGKIFERFYRLGSELRRETQGIGIGLSIVKHIVEAHGGRVTVVSAPGQGSRFTLELPAPPPRPPTEGAAP